MDFLNEFNQQQWKDEKASVILEPKGSIESPSDSTLRLANHETLPLEFLIVDLSTSWFQNSFYYHLTKVLSNKIMIHGAFIFFLL